MNPVKLAIIAVVSVVVLFLALASVPFTIVGAGERAVIIRLGAVNRVLSSGVHWVTPFVESVEKLSVQVQKEQLEATAASKDLQTVTTVMAINYNLDPDKLDILWEEIGRDYKLRVLDPAIQEAVKASTAKYDASELVTKREQVREDIKTLLKERLTRAYITVTEVSIVNFDFSPSFNQAIEAKVTAEQNALASKNKLEQSKYEAEQRIAQARGEAEAIRIQASAINAQGGEDYVRLKAIEKWNGSYPSQYWGSPSAIPLINIGK